MANESNEISICKENVFSTISRPLEDPLGYIQVILICMYLFLKLKSQHRGKKRRDASDESVDQETDNLGSCVSKDALSVRDRLNIHETLILRLIDEQTKLIKFCNELATDIDDLKNDKLQRNRELFTSAIPSSSSPPSAPQQTNSNLISDSSISSENLRENKINEKGGDDNQHLVSSSQVPVRVKRIDNADNKRPSYLEAATSGLKLGQNRPNHQHSRAYGRTSYRPTQGTESTCQQPDSSSKYIKSQRHGHNISKNSNFSNQTIQENEAKLKAPSNFEGTNGKSTTFDKDIEQLPKFLVVHDSILKFVSPKRLGLSYHVQIVKRVCYKVEDIDKIIKDELKDGHDYEGVYIHCGVNNLRDQDPKSVGESCPKGNIYNPMPPKG